MRTPADIWSLKIQIHSDLQNQYACSGYKELKLEQIVDTILNHLQPYLHIHHDF